MPVTLRHRTVVLARMLTIALVLLAASAWAALPAPAALGDYSVTVPTTFGFPGMDDRVTGGPYSMGGLRVSTGAGSYAASTSGRWRVTAPHRTVRIVGGVVEGYSSTPSSAFEAQVRQGSIGGAARELMASPTGGSFQRNLYADNDWVDVGLYAKVATRVTTSGSNVVRITRLVVRFRDYEDPSITIVGAPDADAWHGAGCAQFAIRAADQGAGIRSLTLANATAASLVDSWEGAPAVGVRPGTVDVSRSGCITGSEQQHGGNLFVVRATDAGGRVSERQVRARFDLVAPTVEGGIEADATVTSPRPATTFSIADADSGLATVVASIDGAAATVTNDLSRYTVASTGALAVGWHVLELHATDAVGNERVVTRRFGVGDVTPPTISIVSPGDAGDAQPWLAATATDEGSGVDVASWQAKVNGRPLALLAVGNGASAPVGMLTAGVHTIVVSVADGQGNRATVTRTYTVEGVAGVAGSLAIGSRSGVFVASAPRVPVTYGSTARYVVAAASDGRPLGGVAVRAWRGSTLLASAVADEHGFVELSFLARRGGTITFTAGGSVPATSSTLRVAPRITISVSTSSPRIGRPVRVSGVVQPALMGRRVSLQARLNGSWYTIRRSVPVGTGGRFSTDVRSSLPGDIAVRVRMSALSPWAAGVSNTRVLHVRP